MPDKKSLAFLIGALPVLFLSACSNGEETPLKEDHVWKAKTDTIAHTRDVVDDVEKSMQLQQQRLDNSQN